MTARSIRLDDKAARSIRRNLEDALVDALATYEHTKLYRDLRFAREIQGKIEVFDRRTN